jgi:hypothetical protein
MRTLPLALAATALAGGSLLGHHSYTAYTPNQLVSIEGRIESYRYEQPHVTFIVRDNRARGYVAEWAAINRLRASGVLHDTLKNGDRVIVTGRPTRDADDLRIWVQRIERPTDGFRWPTEP